jgi:hypothetical protein
VTPAHCTSLEIPLPHPRVADLLWMQVVLARRSWTALSVTVIALASWALVAFSGAQPGLLFWALGLTSIGGGVVWLSTCQTQGRLQRRLSQRATASLGLNGPDGTAPSSWGAGASSAPHRPSSARAALPPLV